MKKSPFEFYNPKLVELVFKVNNDVKPPFSLENKINFEVQRNDEKSSANVILNVEICGEKSPFYINIKYSALFVWNKEEDATTIDYLLNHNAPALLIGYIRPIVSSTIVSAGYPPYQLPFIDFNN